MFHLMPRRELPADFEQRYRSANLDPVWFDLADPDRVGQYYNWTLDELVYAAKDRHARRVHQPASPERVRLHGQPSLMGSVPANDPGRQRGHHPDWLDAASTSPPTRIAEEYAMLDCISGGRLVPGSSKFQTDATISNGVVPVEQRERYREALELVLKAWQAREAFAWNGKHYQLPMVNLWPRPIQQPHPPIWIPGSGSASTVEFVVDRDDCFCHLSYFGTQNAETLGDYYWDAVAADRTRIPTGSGSCSWWAYRRRTPRPTSTRRTPNTSSTSCCTRQLLPGDPGLSGLFEHVACAQESVARTVRPALARLQGPGRSRIRNRRQPATVRDRLLDGIKRLRIGHLMVLLQFGSMPHELCLKNIDLFCREVLPSLEGLWDDEWEDRWWPERLRADRRWSEREYERRAGAGACGPGRTGSKHRLRWSAAARHWSICTDPGVCAATPSSWRGWVSTTRFTRRCTRAPHRAIRAQFTSWMTCTTWSCITPSCSSGSRWDPRR